MVAIWVVGRGVAWAVECLEASAVEGRVVALQAAVTAAPLGAGVRMGEGQRAGVAERGSEVAEETVAAVAAEVGEVMG